MIFCWKSGIVVFECLLCILEVPGLKNQINNKLIRDISWDCKESELMSFLLFHKHLPMYFFFFPIEDEQENTVKYLDLLPTILQSCRQESKIVIPGKASNGHLFISFLFLRLPSLMDSHRIIHKFKLFVLLFLLSFISLSTFFPFCHPKEHPFFLLLLSLLSSVPASPFGFLLSVFHLLFHFIITCCLPFSHF